MKEKYTDKSEDKKYFTIIPNYIINHSTVYEQSLYLLMKRIAGENGSCWSSPNELGKRLGISGNTVRKYREKLIKRGWIKKIGKKKIGATNQITNEYEIVDLWDLNSKYYQEKKVSVDERFQEIKPLKVSTGEQKVSTGGRQRFQQVDTKKNPIKKNNKEDNPKGLGKATRYGNALVSKFLIYLKEKAEVIDTPSKWQRRFSWILIRKMMSLAKEKKGGEATDDEVWNGLKFLVDAAAADKFHSQRAGNIRYLYQNIGAITKSKSTNQRRVFVSPAVK